MGMMASQITSLAIVYSTVYLCSDQIKNQSSVSLAFVWGIHRSPVNYPHKGQWHGKCFHLMTSSWIHRWFRQWLATKQATSHYQDQCWPSCLMPYGITGPQGTIYHAAEEHNNPKIHAPKLPYYHVICKIDWFIISEYHDLCKGYDYKTNIMSILTVMWQKDNS